MFLAAELNMTTDFDANTKAAIYFLDELDTEIRAMFEALRPRIEAISRLQQVPDLNWVEALNRDPVEGYGDGVVCKRYLCNFGLGLKTGKRANRRATTYLSAQVSLDTPDGVPSLMWIGLWDEQVTSVDVDAWDAQYLVEQGEWWKLQSNFLLTHCANDDSKHWSEQAWAFAVPLKKLNNTTDLEQGIIAPLIDVLKREKAPEAILSAHKQYLYQVVAT
jgi:hypothetical protein